MDKKSWIIFGVIIFGFLGFAIFKPNSSKIDYSKFDNLKYQSIDAIEENGKIKEHIYNDEENSKIVLIEYGDFQCPSCASVDKQVKKLAEDYKGKVQIIFRNYPLEGHGNALSAAAAVESAGLQGKYWEMHNKIFEKQSEWAIATATERTELYKKYAEESGVENMDKFIEDMKSSSVSNKISFDKNLGKLSKISATPTFILNGKNISAKDEEIRKEIEKLIEK